MSPFFQNIIRFVLILGIQILVLENVHLQNLTLLGSYNLFKPQFYILFILMLQININRNLILIIAFFTGLVMDLFTNQPGLHTSACVLLAFVRPFLIDVFFQTNLKDKGKFISPSIAQMGFPSFITYAAIATLIYNFYYYLISVWSFTGTALLHILTRTMLSVLIGLILFIFSQALFINTSKKRRR